MVPHGTYRKLGEMTGMTQKPGRNANVLVWTLLGPLMMVFGADG